MTDTLRLLPDAELLVPAWLRAQPEVDAIADGNVLDRFEADQEWPACRVDQIDDAVIGGDSYRGTNVLLQFTCVGGNDDDAKRLAETIRSVLVQRYNGRITFGEYAYTVHKVKPGGIREVDDTSHPGPDASTTGRGLSVPAAKPTRRFDAVITLSA